MPAVERSRVSDPSTIPRPPNSWILYRSDMVALLAPPPPGTTRSQAEVSRIISAMWKTEKPEVKAEYERRAEVKKLEHAAMYPNYRYTPKSKELKEELKKAKEEKRKKKNKRDPPGSDASEGLRAGRDPPFTSHGYPFIPVDSSQHVHGGGPSPPMSAAGSPSPEPFQLPQPISAHNERVNEPVAHSQGQSYYRSHTVISHPAQQHPVPQQLTNAAPLQPPTISHYRMPADDSPAQPNELYFHPGILQHPSSQPEQNQDQQYALLQNNAVVPTQNEDYLSFDLQHFAADSLGQWALQNPEFQPTLDHFLDNTSVDCYQLQINPHTQGNLDQTSVGPLEIEVGQIDFNFSHLQWDSNAMGLLQPLFNNAPLESVSFENTAGPSVQTSPSEASDRPSSGLDQSFQLDQYINFNPSFDFVGPSPVVEEIAVMPARASYVPPAGAAHVGRRRVAGSWNASFAIQDPIDV